MYICRCTEYNWHWTEPTATSTLLRDRKIVYIEWVYTPSTFYMKSAVPGHVDCYQLQQLIPGHGDCYQPLQLVINNTTSTCTYGLLSTTTTSSWTYWLLSTTSTTTSIGWTLEFLLTTTTSTSSTWTLELLLTTTTINYLDMGIVHTNNCNSSITDGIIDDLPKKSKSKTIS